MKLLFVLFFCAAAGIGAQGSNDENPEVTAPVGRIRGSTLNSRHGRTIYSFRAIRYAKSPTGPLRFKVPVPVDDWHDVFDATQEGPSCPRLLGRNISEDCLRLNVYTTKLPCKDEDVKRPVMVFFHPGAFYSFTAVSSFFGPDYLMDKDIVLVTVGFRQGTLGFLSTGDEHAPGNMGLKDQVIALRWVQRNIAAFGGDPNSVTISGYSIGGISVILHMVSPMSRNLFHRGIVMSAALSPASPYPTHQLDVARKQAEMLDCPTDSSAAIVSCLNTKSTDDFFRTMPLFFEWNGHPWVIWKAVIEPEIPGVERFLTEQPLESLKKGNFQQVPLIIGHTVDEIASTALIAERQFRAGNDSIYRDLNEDWNTYAPLALMYERGTPRSRYVSQDLRQFYFQDKPVNSDTQKQLADIFSDAVVIYPVHTTAKVIAQKSSQPVYYYEFAYRGRFSFVMWNDTTTYGVLHHDDLQYLFYMQVLFDYLDLNAPEAPMVEKYTAMWSNFVTSGEPIPKNDKMFGNLRWERYSPQRDNYLEITLQPTMKTGVFPARMREWEKLFPLYPRSSTKH